jgi:hypothetical protein
MTIRDHVRRRVLIGYGLAFVGAGIFMASAFLTDGKANGIDFFLFGFVPFLGAIIYINFAIRCPRCKGNLAFTPAVYPTFSSKYRLNYCPYCGVSVDENV